MKRINLLLISLLCGCIHATAQVEQPLQEPADSVKNVGYMDSLFQELPEVMIMGERPIVKAEQGKLVYDVPRLVGNLPVDNAYDILKNLPGIVNMNGSLTLGGQSVTVVINGKVTTLSVEQLDALLKSIPVSRIEKAEVMYSAPARYQVRGPMINLILAPGTGQASSLQGELYTALCNKVTTKKRNAERYSDRIELQGFQSCFRLFVKPSQSPLKPNQDAATLLVRNHARNGDKRTRITKQGVKD